MEKNEKTRYSDSELVEFKELILEKLRSSKPPVITRILEDKVLIDLRTVSESEDSELLEILVKIK